MTNIYSRSFFSGFFTLVLVFFFFQLSAQDGDRYTEVDIAFQDAFLAAKNQAILGDKEEAIGSFKELYRKHRTEASISFELAKLYEATGDLENAIVFAEKAHNADANNSWYTTFLAERYEQNQDHKQASATYSKLLSSKDKNVRYIYEKIAYNQLLSNNAGAALQTLNDLEVITGIDEDISRKKYDMYMAMDQKGLAIKELENLSNAFPGDTRYLRNLAIIYRKENRIEKAKQSLNKLLAIDAEDAEAKLLLAKWNGNGTASKMSTLATLVDSREQPIKLKVRELVPYIENLGPNTTETEINELMSILENLRAKHPGEAAAYALSGDAWYNVQNYDKAIELYEETLKLDDTKYTVWAQLMEAYYVKQDYKTLQKVSENAMDFFPNQALSYIFYAKAGTALGEYDIAEDYLSEAELVSGGSETIIGHVSLARADNLARKGNKKEGKAILQKLTDGKANIHVAHLEYLGDIYHRLEMTEEAIKSWNTAAKGPYSNAALLDKITNKSL